MMNKIMHKSKVDYKYKVVNKKGLLSFPDHEINARALYYHVLGKEQPNAFKVFDLAEFLGLYSDRFKAGLPIDLYKLTKKIMKQIFCIKPYDMVYYEKVESSLHGQLINKLFVEVCVDV